MQGNTRDFSIIKGRILQYLEQKGITKYAFYQSTGTTNGILSQFNGISEENLLRVLGHYTDINLEWLIRGEGEMTLSAESTAENTPATSSYATKRNIGTIAYPPSEAIANQVADIAAEYTPVVESCLSLQTIPLYDAGAGFSALLGGNQHYKPLCQLTLPGLSSCDGAIRIHEDSRTPTLRSGDIVLYKEVSDLRKEILWGEMYLLAFDTPNGEVAEIRRLHKASTAGYIRLESLNPDHAPQEIPISGIRAAALVKATIHYNAR